MPGSPGEPTFPAVELAALLLSLLRTDYDVQHGYLGI